MHFILRLECRMNNTAEKTIPKDNFVHAQLVCDCAIWSVSTAYSQMCNSQTKQETNYCLFQPNGQVSIDVNVFNVYFLWALKKKADFMFVQYLFHRMWWKIDWYPLLKSIVLKNVGNSFCFPLPFPFKWYNCIPEVALFSGCYWSPCFLTQIPCWPNLPPSQGHANVQT